MTKKDTTTDMTDLVANLGKSMQGAVAANPAIATQAEHFWQTQEQLLKTAEAYTRHWFERRHEATRSAMAAARKAAETDGSNPEATMQIVTDWQRHSMERMVEDAREWLEMMTRCAGIAAVGEIEAAEEVMNETKKATKAAKSEPV